MSQTIPHRLPARATAGERRLFAALARLPDDCLVYYEPLVGNRYPDFIVIAPTLGVLTIELKDWRPETIVGADHQSVSLQVASRPGCAPSVVRHNHPVSQARGYMIRLMDSCRRHPATAGLIRQEGSRQGSFFFPFSHVAVLTNVTADQMKQHPAGDLTQIFPAQRVLPREALLQLQEAEPGQMLEMLRYAFDPTWDFPPLTPEQVNALRAIIHPEIVLTPLLPGLDAAPTSPAPLAAAEPVDPVTGADNGASTNSLPTGPTGPSELKVLDLEQERHALQLGDGHRLIFGVAGSGKTVLLVARARVLARRLGPADGKVLVLCYNVILAAHLSAVLRDCAGQVDVFSFHHWAACHHVVRDLAAGETDEDLGQRLLAALQAGGRDGAAYAAVLVDEAQDFEPAWFRCALAALRDPVQGDLLIVGDGSQGLYRRRRVSWKQLGINARGRSVSARFVLDRNYRNSREIIGLARTFAAGPAHPSGEVPGRITAAAAGAGEEADEGVTAPAVDLTKCPRSTGIAPVIIVAADRLGECRRAWQLLRDLLRGRWEGRAVTPLAPAEIGVLYAGLGRDRVHAPLLRRFVDGLKRLAPTVWLSDPDQRAARRQVGRQAIKVQTIHSAKGLQYRAVVLLWADDLPGPGRGVEPESVAADRRLFYVGMTRAEDYLAICHSGAGAPFIVEAARALARGAGSPDGRLVDRPI